MAEAIMALVKIYELISEIDGRIWFNFVVVILLGALSWKMPMSPSSTGMKMILSSYPHSSRSPGTFIYSNREHVHSLAAGLQHPFQDLPGIAASADRNIYIAPDKTGRGGIAFDIDMLAQVCHAHP